MAEVQSPVTSSSSSSDKPLDTRTRDVIADGLVDLLKPAVEEIDERVSCVRDGQLELRQQIDTLAEELKKITEQEQTPMDLEPYVKKLNTSRRRVTLVNNILQNVQERLNKLHTSVSKETARRKSQLDPGATGPPK